ncbi:hypothetical protein GCM10022423_06050 [Flavobacterium ginsengiterrae]|uniref:Uncharacterized protein n=1 Tax=Flavobacterium ginsengiterrae TaxID=871695 RepID=A0ABP7G7H9_9FLAO
MNYIDHSHLKSWLHNDAVIISIDDSNEFDKYLSNLLWDATGNLSSNYEFAPTCLSDFDLDKNQQWLKKQKLAEIHISYSGIKAGNRL